MKMILLILLLIANLAKGQMYKVNALEVQIKSSWDLKFTTQSLRHPRPQNDLAESRRYFAFDPIGGGVTAFGSRTMGLDITGSVGTIKVTTS